MEAHISYTADTGERLVNETFGPNNIRRRSTGAQDAVLNFFDAQELKRVYFREIEQLVRSRSGAARVVVFDHTLRSGDEGEREARLIREPVLSAHNDYTEWSGSQRVREVMGEKAEALLAPRFAIIQVWRVQRSGKYIRL